MSLVSFLKMAWLERITSLTQRCMVDLQTWTTSMISKSQFKCPVCGYDELDEPAYDEHDCASFGICPCCGTEFGYDDSSMEHARLREIWKQKGMNWWSNSVSPPEDWNPATQLSNAGFDR